MRCYVSFILVKACLSNGMVVVDRGTIDEFNTTYCRNIKEYDENVDMCACSRNFPTLASRDREHITCTTHDKFKCDIFPNIKVISNNETILTTLLSKHSNCIITKIQLLDIRPENNSLISTWVDATQTASQYFYINRTSEKAQLQSKQLDDSWQGQVIKITLDCNNTCGLIKVRGRISYPFHLNQPTSSNATTHKILGIVVFVVILLVIIAFVLRLRHSTKEKKQDDEEEGEYEERGERDEMEGYYQQKRAFLTQFYTR